MEYTPFTVVFHSFDAYVLEFRNPKLKILRISGQEDHGEAVGSKLSGHCGPDARTGTHDGYALLVHFSSLRL